MPSTVSLCLRWRRWIRPLVIGFYFLAVVVAIPIGLWVFQKANLTYYKQAWFIGGWFVVLTLPISLWGIVQHLVHYTRPDLQIRIIRILWMVPIYSCDAWLGLRFPGHAIYFDTLRECYEAYVIYNFMGYLLTFLYSEYENLDQDYLQRPKVSWIAPLCCLPPWTNGPTFLKRCKHGVLQYTVMRPFLTIIAFITQLVGVYHEGEFTARGAWVYIVFFNNLSQMWAMYCLVMFYKATKDELQPINPVGKFLCIKAVVFFSFWQSVFIALLVHLNVIHRDENVDFSSQDLAAGLQDLIICIEMLLAALIHLKVFSHKPYIDPTQDYQNCLASFRAMWDVSDVRDDVLDHVRHVGSSVTNTVNSVSGTVIKNRARPSNADAENEPLLAEDGNRSANASTSYAALATPPVNVSVDDFEDVLEQESERVRQVRERRYPEPTEAATDQLIDISEQGVVTNEPAEGVLTDDNVSTVTLDSNVSALNRSFNSSLNNYARFSDTDTSAYDAQSQSSQHSSVSRNA